MKSSNPPIVDTETAILISSCDGYSDAWDVFFKAFFKYWPDCPYTIYMTSESKEYPDSRINFLHVGEKQWAPVVKKALAHIPARYIIYLQEDYFLNQRISSARIQELVDIVKKERAAYLRLYPSPRPNKHFKEYSNIGIITPGAPYRLSLQAAIWDKNIFNKLILENESPWETEIQGSKRTITCSEPFLSVWTTKDFNYVCTGIIKGKWSHDALYFCRKEHFELKTEPRGIEPYRQYVRRKLINIPYIGRVFKIFYRVKKKIKNYFRA